jgi:hypothetical protein
MLAWLTVLLKKIINDDVLFQFKNKNKNSELKILTCVGNWQVRRAGSNVTRKLSSISSLCISSIALEAN